MDNICKLYLDNVGGRSYRDGDLELEVRFGTTGKHRLTRVDYDNVAQYLASNGFVASQPEHHLRIMSEYGDARAKSTRMSNVRGLLTGMRPITRYCQTELPEEGVIEFEQKSLFKGKGAGAPLYPVKFDDFNFRISLQVERRHDSESPLVRTLLDNWQNSKKLYRHMNRCTFRSKLYPVKVDLTIVKTGEHRSFKDSGALGASPSYEVEIEVDNQKIGAGTEYNTFESLAAVLRRVIKVVLSGLQMTHYPISYPEQQEVADAYMKVLWGEKHSSGRIYPKNFAGPSSATLQLHHIQTLRTDYTVTEKADGDRKLLYVAASGKVYLIDTNMRVQFTGGKTEHGEFLETVLDGEHILHNKQGDFLNLYAAFDIYYLKRKDVRALPFILKDPQGGGDQARLTLLHRVVGGLGLTSVIPNAASPIQVESKRFESVNKFSGCKKILDRIQSGLFEYETDGLIFTPANTGVGCSNPTEKPRPPMKATWGLSFKWKPASHNTIDFMVTFQRNEDGAEKVGNIFKSGRNTQAVNQLHQYKTMVLRVGFDERKHGFLNPMLNVVEDTLPGDGDTEDGEGYKPARFYPTNPSDVMAGVCQRFLNPDNQLLLAESGDVIEDKTIVEFRYDMDRDEGWRWVPLRVRHDKTAEFRAGGRNFGNAYHVANSNWQSIHRPITEEMISTGEGIPEQLGDDDVYYNRGSSKTGTRRMRDFHNLFVKKQLIMGASPSSGTLIDLAVGKGGDISKWEASKLKFVFGVDVSRDNIENRLDGACARYLRKKRERRGRDIFKALFVQGNSSVNIRNTMAVGTEKEKQVTRAVFGEGGAAVNKLGKGVEAVYGWGADGFDVCSIQFAVHYMFESTHTLHQFLRNVSETTKVGGHFIGTSYDGNQVFEMLKHKKVGESATVMEADEKLWEVTKQYEQTKFDAEQSSVGYAIDVYQDSINKMFREYLVNYDYLSRLLENYGFVPITREEANRMGLPSGTGLFHDLFETMNAETRKNPRTAQNYGTAANMTPGERKISFLNRFFVFKKVRAVDAENVANSLMNANADGPGVLDDDAVDDNAVDETKEEEAATEDAKEEAATEDEAAKAVVVTTKKKGREPDKGATDKRPRKLKRKLVLKSAPPK